MKPKAWSYTALEDFVNCPRSYYEKRIAKSVIDDPNQPHLLYGNRVHKEFELYVGEGIPLSDDLLDHQTYLDTLRDKPGLKKVERKIAFNTKGAVCGNWDTDPPVWMRGVIDFSHIEGDRAEIVDYKTGKQHTKFKQLKLFALHIFAEFPEVQTVRVDYYWTQTRTRTGEGYNRRDIPHLWTTFTGDLRQYAQAFREDIWQPRQSGLCNGWCPVTACEFWKPKRDKK